MPPPPHLVVFTDLDGTLLDHDDYTWQAAAPALQQLALHEIPLILNSSKTVAEQLALRRDLQNHHPFLAENGLVQAIPVGYFEGVDVHPDTELDTRSLATPYATVREVLESLRDKEGYRFRGFADLDNAALAELCSFSEADAALARQRQGSEPLVWDDSEQRLAAFCEKLAELGLQSVRGGRFLHVSGPGDKGRAIPSLMAQYRAQTGQPCLAAALGDSDNDLPMLRAVDCPIIIPRTHGEPLCEAGLKNVRKAPTPGPVGWNLAMLSLLDELGFA